MRLHRYDVMAKARIGHFVEAKVLESLGVDYLDESEVLTPADTPPAARISEGTRSRAITAVAPAASAILACSAFMTSMVKS
jgi:pyridoxal biosynthesis lyase PdxS